MIVSRLPPLARWRRHRSPSDGFTFLETLVALVLVGVALLLPLSLLAQDVRASERLDAQHQVRRQLEIVLELLRVGVLPLRSGPLDPTVLPEVQGAAAPSFRLDVSATATPNLHEVRAEARYQVRGVELVQHSMTLMWKPP